MRLKPPRATGAPRYDLAKAKVNGKSTHEETQTRSGTLQGGHGGGREIRGGARRGGVRADRLRESEAAVHLPPVGPRQGHSAAARRPGRRNHDAAQAGDLVFEAAAE